MAIFDILGGEFIEVIEWTDDTRDTMVWRFPTVGNAIKYGAKLTVREGQAAVFVHEGQLADTFGPGLYMLETNNLPIMTRLQHWDHGFRSPFKSEVYFVNTTRFNDLKWGTKNPVIARDPEFGPVRIGQRVQASACLFGGAVGRQPLRLRQLARQIGVGFQHAKAFLVRRAAKHLRHPSGKARR